MITREDLKNQFENETNIKADKDLISYLLWLEKLYIDKLNEEKELNDKLTEFMLQDGE